MGSEVDRKDEFLFIGGPRDGQRHKLLCNLPVTVYASETSNAVYYPRDLWMGGVHFVVFADRSLSKVEVLQRLLDAYGSTPLATPGIEPPPDSSPTLPDERDMMEGGRLAQWDNSASMAGAKLEARVAELEGRVEEELKESFKVLRAFCLENLTAAMAEEASK